MKVETLKTAVEILEAQGRTVSLEYPGHINIEHHAWVYVFGGVNELFGADVYRSWTAYEEGLCVEGIETPLLSDDDAADPAAVAAAVIEAIRSHQEKQEPRFYVMNETDEVLANPEPMSQAECDVFMTRFRERFAKQGYYASVKGRVPLSELRLKRIPEAEL